MGDALTAGAMGPGREGAGEQSVIWISDEEVDADLGDSVLLVEPAGRRQPVPAAAVVAGLHRTPRAALSKQCP